MNRLRQRFLTHADPEGGLTLIEVMVAMVIFTIISVGLLYTMVSLLSVTRDSRNRQVASNLAAQEIDLARDVSDIFDLTFYERDVSLNGDAFHVERTAAWVYSSGDVAPCGSGSGSLRYKFVEVVVTWDGMRGDGVRSETLINPNERINDPNLGTMIVSVNTASGVGVPNVPVTATPTTGTVRTGTTDSEGCAFILGVTPGDFTVRISSPPATSYVDIAGLQQPTRPATVVEATSVSVPFTYDPAGTLRATYGVSSLLVPNNLSTSLLSTRDTAITTATSASNPRSFLVSPWADGYSVVSGNTTTCAASDPGLWTASGSKLDGVRPDPVAAASGATTDVTVPTSTLRVTGMSTSGSSSNRYLVAVSKNVATDGQPGCATTQILRFDRTSVSTMTVSLPYGTWDLYKGTTASFLPPGQGTKISNSDLTVLSGGSVNSGVVTLDPRGSAG